MSTALQDPTYRNAVISESEPSDGLEYADAQMGELIGEAVLQQLRDGDDIDFAYVDFDVAIRRLDCFPDMAHDKFGIEWLLDVNEMRRVVRHNPAAMCLAYRAKTGAERWEAEL